MSTFEPPVKALFFDVFGTCVDWRKPVTDALWNYAKEALNSPAASLNSRIRTKASDMTYEDWGEVAQEWRNSYLTFTKSIAADSNIPYKTVDEVRPSSNMSPAFPADAKISTDTRQHFLDALREILIERDLIFPRQGDVPAASVHDGSLWDKQQIVMLSLTWHHLDPWPDTAQGIRELNKKFQTCTLSNGNVTLLDDMVKHGKMGFTHIYSSQMFLTYKPNPKVYLGAVEKIGLKPEECMMVAAHLDDLKFAKQNGLRTLYVERPQEERHPELRDDGIPDIWVKDNEQGFIAAAEKLGIQVST